MSFGIDKHVNRSSLPTDRPTRIHTPANQEPVKEAPLSAEEKKNSFFKAAAQMREKNTQPESDSSLYADLRDIGHFYRAVLNNADADFNGELTYSELQELDIEATIEMGTEMGLGDIRRRVEHLVSSSEKWVGQGLGELVYKRASDYRTTWRAQGDYADIAIAAAQQQPLKPERVAALIESCGAESATARLTDTLQSQGALSSESLLYLEKALEKHGLEVLNEVSETLLQFLASDSGQLSPAEKQELSQDLLHDLAFPENIDQAAKGSCAAAALQMKLAITQPSKYVQLATTLAQNKPYVLSPERSLAHNTSYANDPTDTRRLSAKILQNSLMDAGLAHKSQREPDKTMSYTQAGQQIFYDSRISIDKAQSTRARLDLEKIRAETPALRDKPDAELRKLGEGLESDDMAYLEQQLFGEQVQGLKRGDLPATEIRQRIDAALAGGQAVTLDLEDHVAVITEKRQTSPPVYTLACWGKTFAVSEAQLEKILRATRVQ